MPKEIRIVQICEPVFLYICELNRLRREGVSAEATAVKFGTVRHRIDQLLENCAKQAGASNRLQEQWKDIELPLCCFVDFMIEEILGTRGESDLPLPAAKEWGSNLVADERFSITTGNNEFFNRLDAELARRDNDLETRERLEFYYACLGLGFSGKYQGDPAGLDACKQEVAGRVQHLLTKGSNDDFTPDAYEHLNPAKLNLEPQPVLWGVAIMTVVVVLFFFVATAWLYKDSATGLETAIKAINQYGADHPGLHN